MNTDSMEAVAIDPRQVVITLGQQGKHWRDIAAEAGVNVNTVRTWLRRAGIRTNSTDSNEIVVAKRKDSPNEDHSSVVRGRLGKALVKVTEALERMPMPRKRADMIAQAELVKSIADPAKSVFGWSDTQVTNVLSISHLSTPAEWAEPTPVLDVPATVAPASPVLSVPDGTVPPEQSAPVTERS